ncbi:MAG: hypothetical protein WA740_12630 [Candidatus Binataceae bacterium]
MSRAAIVVRTANRPEILNRCIEQAVDGCSVAREAFWIILDDSSPEYRGPTREITRFWKRFGLRLACVDKTVEQEIAESLPEATLRNSFAHLVARRTASATEGGRNLALVTGFSLNPDVLFLVDDDMVVRHEKNCFFHWCVNLERPDSFIAAPRELGIRDMTYLERLKTLLNRDESVQFVSDAGLSADPESWYSPTNPLWNRGDNINDGAIMPARERRSLNGQLIAFRGKEAEFIPFPDEYNADLNWSLLQAAFHGTALLEVGGANAQHLPPRIGHSNSKAIISELVGTAITRALREIKPRGDQLMSTLASRLPDVLRVELKRQLLPFLAVERAIQIRVMTCANNDESRGTLEKIQTTLADAADRLKSIDPRQIACEWLNDFADRHRMFLELRRNEAVQLQIRRILFDASV